MVVVPHQHDRQARSKLDIKLNIGLRLKVIVETIAKPGRALFVVSDSGTTKTFSELPEDQRQNVRNSDMGTRKKY